MPHRSKSVNELLRDARILDDEYRDYQPPSAQQRLARALDRRARHAEAAALAASGAAPGPGSGTGAGSGTGTGTEGVGAGAGVGTGAGAGAMRPAAAAPNSGPEHEQARHELNLTSTLVLNAPQAAASLARLTETLNDPDGALVFACLLFLTAREDGARFWWKFAAGAGNPTAAFCLYLDHRRNAEYRDADYWRRQSARLRQDPLPPDRVTRARSTLLPTRQLRDLLAECHRGQHPQLPLPVEGAIKQLPVAHDDCFDGQVPTPSSRLFSTLGGSIS